jgi:hypothetical protein
MLLHEIGRFWVASPDAVDESFVIFRVGSPRIRRMAPQQHSRLGGECFVGAGQPLAARQADQFVVKAQVGRNRFLGWSPLARLPCAHRCQLDLQA